MRVGSLFSGYGGLDMAVGGNLAWYSEIEPAACKVLAAHHPKVKNLGDITTVDWETVPTVDVITGGYPCQPFSTAGQRKGTKDVRHLWPYVRDAISHLRPKLAVLENVRGHLSLGLADVIGDLAFMGYDARWGLVRASDAGAPHGRARVFIVAYPTALRLEGAKPVRLTQPVGAFVTHDCSEGTFTNPHSGGHGEQQDSERMGGMEGIAESEAQEWERSWGFIDTRSIDPVANAHSVNRKAQHDGRQGPGESGRFELMEHSGSLNKEWGKYGPAICRWENVLGRKAPAATVYRADRERLNPGFVEWMMGLPKGHVTGHGLTATQELKMLGNGVCPQQAELAIRLLTEWGNK